MDLAPVAELAQTAPETKQMPEVEAPQEPKPELENA